MITETDEQRAERCYELYCNLTGDQTSPDWGRLTVAQREMWRRVVERARQESPLVTAARNLVMHRLVAAIIEGQEEHFITREEFLSHRADLTALSNALFDIDQRKM